MQKPRALACALTLCIGVIGCDGSTELISNPMVDRWCGEHPCEWEVTEGEVKRVGTWHTDDYAVELRGDATTLSQASNFASTEDTNGFAFSMIAKVDAQAHLYLELDFLDDGSVEYSQRVPESDWQRRMFCISPPSWFRKVRFILRKEGPGRTVIAALRAFTDTSCDQPQVELLDRPDGARCENDEQCSSHLCTDGNCAP